MKLNKYLCLGAALASMPFLASCGEDLTPDNNGNNNGSNNGEAEATTLIWPADTVVNLTSHYEIPEGTRLVIKEGAQIIASTEGVGANHTPIEFTVKGNLYCEGTAEKPIRFSIAQADRTQTNIFHKMWGGIVATETCQEMLIDHTIIEYTGGQVVEGSPAANNGIYTAGDDAYPQITANNINGKYVITNSIIRNGWSDGIYLMGGKAIIANNTFAANGYDGAEAVNIKAGCQADIAGNIMFSPNTNGLKLSSSGQSESRGQAKVQAYNNTIINAGWRRDGEKGGCIFVEKNALVHVFNNLMVNCKFKAMTPSFDTPNDPEEGYDNRSVIDYNFYASGRQESKNVFESGIAHAWEGYNYNHKDYNKGVTDLNSIVATEEDGKDPKFVNFNIENVSLTEYYYAENSNWDFHVQSGSPVLNGAYSGTEDSMAPFFAAEGLAINGNTYKSPAVQALFGAYGNK